ncbi:hypothetical protein [Streptomyces sp. NPDC000351]|uniref:hypothetical protein n=1 Tax=Streptomyces sp. NPDC000351 TaxID=3154250 RepID=UPI0033324281
MVPTRDGYGGSGTYVDFGSMEDRPVRAPLRERRLGKLNDHMRCTYHGVGGLFTRIPVVGDPIQRMVDAATYEYSKDVAAAAEDAASSKDSTATSAGISGTNALLGAWGTEHGIRGTEAHDHAMGEAEQSFITGREDRTPST